MLYQMIELGEGVEVQYLGVSALKWQYDEWGPPSVGFVARNVFNLMITYICAHCGAFAEVPFLEVEVLDSGTVLTCNRCGEDTVFDLDTSELRAQRHRAYVDMVHLHDVIEELFGQYGDFDDEESLLRDVEAMWVRERQALHRRVKELERRVEGEKEWAQHREDMYTAVRRLLRRAGVIKPHEEITVEDAVKRLLRKIPARAFDPREVDSG